MNRDSSTSLIPFIIGLALILVKLFVLMMIITVFLILFLVPQLAGEANLSPVIQNVLPESTPTISPEDAAIANSEWSGARIIKTSLPVGTPFIIPTRIATVVPVQNASASNSPVPTAISNIQINSPLEGFGIGDLQELVSQEFKAPPPGEDSGHHGVDFAFWSRGNKPILGVPILAVFPGKVAMSDSMEKPPYGFALMIETPLSSLSQTMIQSIKIPTQPIGTTINNKLSCPDLSKDQWSSTSKSLYTLYGHMISAPAVKPGENIQIGQPVGYVGNSGYSTAPHLHLEMRIGPSGISFSNMGHYDPITTEQDRHNYCNWRVSGVFQMFDPMDLFRASLVKK
jgi:murein DD-endopeptidase MepM/ murein hydrolase activator NlpD